MPESQQAEYSCDKCEASVSANDLYCKNCGAIFTDSLFCFCHNSVPAKGVCVICSKPFCKNCGSDSNRVYLCDQHWRYEIHEGMARVFGCIDNVQAQYVTDCLKQAGCHPFFYSRYNNPGPGMVSTWVLVGVRNYGNHPIVEMKVLVPFAEVLKAEETLKQLGFMKE
jgi:hypothetical protein